MAAAPDASRSVPTQVTVNEVEAKAPLLLPLAPIGCAPTDVEVGRFTFSVTVPLPSEVGVPKIVVLVQAGWPQLYLIVTVSCAPKP